MRLHRFIGHFNLFQKELDLNEDYLIHQIKKVLRLKVLEQFILADGELNEARVEIKSLGPSQIKVKILEILKNKNEPAKKVSLYAAILKKENFEIAIQKAVEVGIFEIFPTITERTIKTDLNLERLKKIIHEAAEQSGRGILPTIHNPILFNQAIKNSKNNLSILLDPNSNFNIQNSDWSDKKSIGLFVGPEGGFTQTEIKLAEQNKFEIISLSQLTLRAETAAIVGSYLTTKY